MAPLRAGALIQRKLRDESEGAVDLVTRKLTPTQHAKPL